MLRKTRSELVIELTPLLDVILIILFLVMMTSQNQANAKQAELAESHQEQLAKLQLEQEDLSRKLAAKEEALDYALSSKNLNRQQLDRLQLLEEEATSISVRIPDSYPELEIELIEGEKLTRGFDQLSQFDQALRESLTKTDKPLVFLSLEYNARKLYNEDYQKINRIILQARANSDQTILYREYDRSLD